MVWVQRNAAAAIVGVYANQQPGVADEQVSDADPTVVAFLNPPKPQTVRPQDMMAQFTSADIATIQTAIAADASRALLWYSFLAQADPMMVTNARFLAGWNALIAILGQPRMTALAAALGVTV